MARVTFVVHLDFTTCLGLMVQGCQSMTHQPQAGCEVQTTAKTQVPKSKKPLFQGVSLMTQVGNRLRCLMIMFHAVVESNSISRPAVLRFTIAQPVCQPACKERGRDFKGARAAENVSLNTWQAKPTEHR